MLGHGNRFQRVSSAKCFHSSKKNVLSDTQSFTQIYVGRLTFLVFSYNTATALEHRGSFFFESVYTQSICKQRNLLIECG